MFDVPCRLTPSGWILVVLTGFTALFAFGGENNVLLLLFCFELALLLYSAVAGTVALRNVTVRRSTPGAFYVGSPTWVRVDLELASGVPGPLHLAVEEQLRKGAAGDWHTGPGIGTSVRLERGGTCRSRLRLIPRKRGTSILRGFRLRTESPFGFIRCARNVTQKQRVTVRPRLARLIECPDPEPVRPGTGNGTSRWSAAEEFAGVREYRRGDDPRRIDWKSLAKHPDQLRWNMFDARRQGTLLLLVETYVPVDPGPGSRAPVENVLGAACAAARHFEQNGRSTIVMVNGADRRRFAPSSQRMDRDALETSLANVTRATEDGFQSLPPDVRQNSPRILCVGSGVRTRYSDASWADLASWLDLADPGDRRLIEWDARSEEGVEMT